MSKTYRKDKDETDKRKKQQERNDNRKKKQSDRQPSREE